MKLLCTLTLSLAMFAACAPIVNIPAQKGDTAFHDPNTSQVRQVMTEALVYTLANRPIDKPFQLLLPVGSSTLTYANILPTLGEHAMWSSDGLAKDVPVVSVNQIRIRGSHAEVDIIRPIFASDLNASGQTVTVTLKYAPMEGWSAYRIKEWRGDISETANPMRSAEQRGL